MEKEIIFQLIKKYRWSEEQIYLAMRANFRCEYCDKDLFENIENYKLWEIDHIIPKSCNISNYDYECFDNKAIACRQCNVSFKSRYNPILEIGEGKTRKEYINIIRKKLSHIRNEKQSELEEIKKLFSRLVVSNY